MHEMSIIMGVMDAVTATAQRAGALRVVRVTLSLGDMVEAIDDALHFAFETLSEGTLCEGAELVIHTVMPKSICIDCGNEFEHDRFHNVCPQCGSYALDLIAGREMQIDSIEVDLPDDVPDDGSGNTSDDASSDIPDNTSDDVTRGVSTNTSQDISKDTPDYKSP